MTDRPLNEMPMYGVWVRRKGWLRGKDVFADYDLNKVKQVAKIVGGTVRYIDQSIIDLETVYIEAERKSLWVTLVNLFKRKIHTYSNKQTTKPS